MIPKGKILHKVEFKKSISFMSEKQKVHMYAYVSAWSQARRSLFS